jgi:hypothetical protein
MVSQIAWGGSIFAGRETECQRDFGIRTLLDVLFENQAIYRYDGRATRPEAGTRQSSHHKVTGIFDALAVHIDDPYTQKLHFRLAALAALQESENGGTGQDEGWSRFPFLGSGSPVSLTVP